MSHKFKGILSFPVLTQQALANKQKRDPGAKYSAMLIFKPDDPQVETLKQIINTEVANGFPNGFPATSTVCFDLYERKVPESKDYFDPRFKGHYVLTMSAPVASKPDVVDASMQPILDPGEISAGAIAWVNCGISKFAKGKQGIGGWLNGVMITNEEMPYGRLDNKPTVEQMFGGIDVAPTSAASSFM
jgi:hypothetical protein